MKKTVTATAAVIKNGEKYLLTQRLKTDHFPLYWEFPGGKVEDGETPEDCLVREIKEELSIDIRVLSPLTFVTWEYKEYTVLLLFYNCSIKSGAPERLECSDFGWFEKEEIRELNLLPADRSVLDRIR